MIYFTYTYKVLGKKKARSLYYDPTLEGWKWVRKINCCVHFTKGDLLLRIKTDTQLVIIEKNGKARPVLNSNPIRSQAEFIQKTNKF